MAASTSTAVHSNNNSCFDVFISHRGPDVKKTFASHLYRRLISYGLRVFLDYQELQEGEEFPCQIKGAIRTASVQIAIFSPTYADSQWCLDELVLMLETRAPIIPVFHHVKPTELRRTQGEGVYATSLRNLEKKRKYDCEPRYDSKTIENWRNALSRVADISGFDLDEGFNGDEGELLDQLVEVVLKKGKKKLNVARYPTGLEEKVEDFEKKLSLQQHSERVQFVGITGLGGAGKTTLAKELFNRKSSSSRYSKSCFLIDVRENVKISIPSLQRKLLKDLSASEEPIDSKDEGLEILRKHFSALSDPVLLVLDDVDDQDQVYALLPVTDKGILPLPPGSLILITSRDKNVLARSGVQESSIYKLTGLDTELSRELFCRHAFCQPHPLSGFEHLVNQFLRASDGLPLSLKVFGGLLYGNTDKSYWQDELDQLRKTLPSEIQKRLQISYDALQTEEKQIFLDIACFFIGESRDSAIRVWDGSGWKGSRGFQSLLNKCLVEVDINVKTMEHYIRMHDHLRDMGRDLANSSGFPCRMWRGTKHIEDLLQQSSEATKVRGIRMLRGYSGEDDDHVSSDDDDERASFSRYKMKNLQLLDIDTGGEEDLLKFLLEGVDSPKLLWFRWLNCCCSSLPPYIPMEKLRVIEVVGYTLETLWQEDSQAPLQLRELRISVAQLFKIPKSIWQLNHLERMVVTSWSDGMIEIPKEFCDLRSLKHLVLRNINMSSLPDSFGNLSTLQHFNLSCCSHLERLPDSFGNLSMLEHINLSWCTGLQRLPYSFGNLSMLDHIDLSGCILLQRLPDSFGNLSRLQHINLSSCDHLERLPDSFGNLSMLEHIDLSRCTALERLPDSFGNLSMLEHIDLSRCTALERLPDSFDNLSRLQHINLSGCGHLERLPDSFWNLSMLEHIDLSHCTALERLPDSFDNLSRLQHINLSGCGHLERLPDSFGNLSRLQHINLSGCGHLERLPDSFGNLSMLDHIELSRCILLQRLPDSFRNLWRLKHINLSCCRHLERLPDSFGNLSRLQHINLFGCGHLKRLPDSFENLSRVQHINLSHCGHLERLPDSFGNLSMLEHINLSWCSGLQRLPDSFGNLSMLEHINLSWCSGLQRLPDSFGDLSRVQHVNLSRCSHLERLPDSFGNLSMLEHINLSWCSGSQRLPDSFGNLSRLQHINLSHWGHLERLPDCFGNLSRLQHIDLSGCRHLELPDSFGNLSMLEHIDLSCCSAVKRLPDSFGKLSRLQHIDLSGCGHLERLPESFGNLIKLKYLNLSGCDKLTIPGGTFLKITLEDMTLPQWRMEVLPPQVVHQLSLKKVLLGLINLTEWPSAIGESSHVEKLVLETPFLETFPPSFGRDLRNLKYLELRSCRSLKLLPDSFLLLNQLIELTVEDCSLRELHVKAVEGESKTLTDSGGQRTSSNFESCLHRLQYLKMHKTQISEISFSTSVCPRLQHLEIRECRDLVEVGTLPDALIDLQLTGCPKLRKIERLCGFPKLQTLDGRLCKEGEELPLMEDKSRALTEWRGQRALSELDSSFDKYLLRLQHLELHSTSISEISFPTGVCPDLQHLEIRECRDLVEVGTLPDALIILQFTDCPKLKKIERLCGFTKIQTLDGSLCKEVEELPLMEDKSRALTEWRGQRAFSDLDSSFDKYLLRLQHLELQSTSISEVSFPTGVCPNLQRLDIRECRDLVEVGTLPDALINLQLTGCPKLSKIERLCGFPKLQTLDGSLCKEVEELPLMEDKSGALTEWRGQRALSDLDSSFDKYLLSLQHLELHSTSISEVSFPTGVCSNLQRLDIRECRDLVEVGTLPDALINLQLTGCPKLSKIERLCGFPKLQTLDGSLCKVVEELPLMEDKSGALTEWRGQRALSDLDSSFDKYLLSLQHLELHSTAISEVSFPTGVCPNLQRLDIRECRDLVDVGTLPDALINLQLAGCPQLKKIERLFAFTEPQTLYRRVHRTFSNLDPLFDKCMLSLQHLEPCNTEISEVSFPKGVYPNLQGKKETLTESIGQRTFNNLDPLFDKSMLSLQHLGPCNTEISEVSFPKGVYPNLQYLSIKHGKSTVEFGKSPNGEFMKLEVLNCCNLRKIEELCGLAKLQVLDTSSCEGVLLSMETLVSLENLQVLGCPNLKSIHGLAHLTHLRELNVSGCTELEELPGLDNLTLLETLLAGECVKLEGIQGLATLTQLGELSVSGSSELQELPGLEHLTSLKKLSANKCVNLKNIKGLEQLTQLRELSISGCSKLQELPGLDHLTSLEMLLAGECAKLESIQGLARLTQLRELSVSGCSQLQELPGLEHLTSLKKLSANKCVNLKNIKGLEQLTQLRELSISGCSKLQELPRLDHLTSLEMLLAGECAKLESIQGLARLTQLRELSVSGCSQLQELPGLEHLTSLKKLSADKCVKLKNIKGLEQLTQVLEVDVSGWFEFELEEMPGVVCFQPLVEFLTM